MNAITVRPAVLKSLLLFAAIKDVRYYLKGVHLETGPNGACLVALDGHRLGAVHCPGALDATSGIIPRELIEKVVKVYGKADSLEITISGEYPHQYDIRGLSARGIDAEFPDWRRILPTEKPNGKGGQFNASYLFDFAKAIKLLGAPIDSMLVSYNGPTTAALITAPKLPEFMGVIMPVRYFTENDTLPEVPAWALHTTATR